MVPHYSGTTLDAQKRYADGAKDILQRYFAGEPQNPANVIVEDGDVSCDQLKTVDCVSMPPKRMVRGRPRLLDDLASVVAAQVRFTRTGLMALSWKMRMQYMFITNLVSHMRARCVQI